MKQIPLTKGKFALVDDDDFEWLNQWKWFVVEGTKVYAATNQGNGVFRKTNLMHRLIADAPAKMQVDHINGNTLDNRKSNLRICTRSENAMNTKAHKDNKTGYKGVYWDKNNKNYAVNIQVNGKKFFVGCFREAIQAAKAYDDATKIHHGKFANLNFPNQ